MLSLEERELEPNLSYDPAIFKEKFKRKLEQGIRHPLGGDKFASDSCSGLLLALEEDPSFLELFSEAQRLKGPSSSTEMANLATVHAVNYIMTFGEGIQNYPSALGLTDAVAWKDKVYSRVQGPYADEYLRLLVEKHANTNIPNRGAHLPFLFHTAFPGQRVKICDVGASGNGILGKLAYNGYRADTPYLFQSDTTAAQGVNGLIRYYANERVDFWGVGFDISNMHSSPEQENWFLVNDYIKNMNEPYLAAKRARMELYRKARNVHFFQGDMTQPHFKRGALDYINFSSTLYELTKEQRALALKYAFEATSSPTGLVGVADRIVVQNGELVFTKDRSKGSYGLALNGQRTGGRWINPIRMADSTCEVYTPGPDWEEYLQLFPPQLECE
ncbi:hypothetical protein IPM65_02895 [Candidatus Roizmanbacteria bacterium]|nr:MAG: hypothetical protein IPM65_02895 [Candidatus Roizmanbacteria bacterium]